MGFIVTSLRIASGIIVWSVHFTLIYGLTAIACARGHAGAVPWIIGTATAVAAFATAAIIIHQWRRREEFAAWLAALLAAFALLGILFEGSTVLIITPCP